MIDYEKYDVIKDADEEKSHLCNSLNAEVGVIHHIIWSTKNKDIPVCVINLKDLERWADYMERSQNVITYFRLEKKDALAQKKHTVVVNPMIEREDLSYLPQLQRERYERQYQSAEQAINVGQLIEKLKEYPQDLPVVVDCDFIEGFRIRDEDRHRP